MKEYYQHVLLPAVKNYVRHNFVFNFVLALVPLFNILYVLGYSFLTGEYFARDKGHMPIVDIPLSLGAFFSCALVLLFLILFLGIMSLTLTLLYNLVYLTATSALKLKSLNILGLFALKPFLIILLALFLLALPFYPLIIIRHLLYRKHERIFDFVHVGKLMFTKESLFNLIIWVLLTSILLIPLYFMPKFNIATYVIMCIMLYLSTTFVFALYGRAFFVFENHHKVDHIPHHAKELLLS